MNLFCWAHHLLTAGKCKTDSHRARGLHQQTYRQISSSEQTDRSSSSEQTDRSSSSEQTDRSSSSEQTDRYFLLYVCLPLREENQISSRQTGPYSVSTSERVGLNNKQIDRSLLYLSTSDGWGSNSGKQTERSVSSEHTAELYSMCRHLCEEDQVLEDKP